MVTSTAVVLDAQTAQAAAQRVARRLAAAGCRPGDRIVLAVGFAGPSGPAAQADYLAVILGATRTGVVPVPLDTALTAPERARLIADASPRLVLDSADQLAALTGSSDPGTVPGQGGSIDLAPVPLVRPMHYTSGTTGTPKGVWSGVLDLPAATALAAEERECWGFNGTDRHLVVAPLHHSAPLRFATGTLLAGGSVVLAGRFDPQTAVAAILTHQPTTTFLAPVHLRRLLVHLGVSVRGGLGGSTASREHPSEEDLEAARALLRSFRLVAHAGAPTPVPVKRAALAVFPPDSVWEFYGSTEGQVTICSPQEWLARPGTVGRARPGRRVHVDDDGTIWCEVPDYARFSYWRDEAKTAAAWRGRSFTVGDLGRLDEDGYLWLEGRRTDLIISGGVNVYPLEVEQVLSGCPGVLDVAVYGVPDDEWGQRVEAAVVGTADEATLRAWARDHLAPAKRPKRFHHVPALPRTASGKLRRRDLTDRARPGSPGPGGSGGPGR